MAFRKEDVVGVECRHVMYVTDQRRGSDNDLLYVKEAVHLKDGSVVPHTRTVENYPVDFYVTKEGFRNHKDKKLFEKKERLHRIVTTQKKMGVAVARALKTGYLPDMRIMARSQFLYGTDVTSATRLKHWYRTKYPNNVSLNTVAVCDLESDVFNTDSRYQLGRISAKIISGSLTFKDRALLVVRREFLGTIPEPEKQIHEKLHYYLGLGHDAKCLLHEFFNEPTITNVQIEHSVAVSAALIDSQFDTKRRSYYEKYAAQFKGIKIQPLSEERWNRLADMLSGDERQEIRGEILKEVIVRRNLKLKVEFVDTPAEIVCKLMEYAHQWQPDFLAFWHMNFDVPAMVRCLEIEGYDPAQVFSDPALPDHYKYFRYQEGPSQKISEAGRVMILTSAERWHNVYTPASFYFIDAMCVYQKIRVAKGKEPNYSLDAILDKNLGIRKLKFKEADGLERGHWHAFMQDKYKIEYLVYNIFDSISVEMLDEKNMDLANTITLLCKASEYSKFPSQPRRTCDRLHFFALDEEEPHVIASTSDKMSDELDELVVDTTDWIVTLPAHQIVNNGICCIEEFPELRSSIRTHVADIDVAAAYPNNEDILNISHETTYREISRIEGLDDATRRKIGINLTGGKSNALEFCRDVYKLPTLEEMYDAFMEEAA